MVILRLGYIMNIDITITSTLFTDPLLSLFCVSESVLSILRKVDFQTSVTSDLLRFNRLFTIWFSRPTCEVH